MSKKQQVSSAAVLGLDTSTRSGSIALVAAGRVLAGLDLSGDLDHSDRLLPGVEFLLDRLGIEPRELAGVAVSVGPGSFTGVRVGLATARGLARAAGLEVVGIGSLEALAALAATNRGGEWVCPWLDAGRGEVYAAAYQAGGSGLEERQGASLSTPEAWLSGLPSSSQGVFLGDGAEAHRTLIAGPGHRVEGVGPWFLARSVARLGEARLRAGEVTPPLPVYVRAPDAQRAGKR